MHMAKIYAASNWAIKVLNGEHPPIHVHVVHPDGMAIVYLDGTLRNARQRVPAAVLKAAIAWVFAHEAEIRAEWRRLGNPDARGWKQ